MKGKIRKTTTKAEAAPENKYIFWGTLAVFLCTAAVMTTCKIEDDDVFWHLSAGRFIAENKYVPDKDVFGYTTQNTDWVPFEWGWDVISYDLYSAGGITALDISRIIVFGLFFYLYFMLLKKFKISLPIAIILLLLLLFAMMDRLSPRPHMFSYLFLLILLNLLFSVKYINREKYLTKLYYLPLIFLVWGNLHPGVITGDMLLVVFIISETIYYYYPSKNKKIRPGPGDAGYMKKLFIVSALSFAAQLINPNGINTYKYAYSHTQMKMLESIQEWLSPFSGLLESTVVIVLYKIFLFSSVIIFIYALKKRDRTFFLTGLVFALYSLRAVRFGTDYEIIAVMLLAISIQFYLSKFVKPKGAVSFILYSEKVRAALIIFMCLVIYSALNNSLYFTLKYNKQTGWGISENYTPEALFSFIKENNITGTPFNNFETGGYMMWTLPGQKIFIDSRNLSDKVFDEYLTVLQTKPGFETIMNNYGIDYVIYFDPAMPKNINILNKNIAGYCSVKPDWKLVYWDDRSMLFLKDVPKFKDIISRFEYRVFVPFNALFERNKFEADIENFPETAGNEIKRKAQTEPQGYFFLNMNDIASRLLHK